MSQRDLSPGEAIEKMEKNEQRLNDMADRMFDLERRTRDLEAENEDLRQQVATLQDRLGTVEGGSDGKDAKVRDLVAQADNLRNADAPGAILTVRDIMAATGVCRRYAYDLVDDLPDEYSFIEDADDAGQYGSLELDTADRPKGIFVDCEAVHSDQSLVNKFTIRSTGGGGSE